MHNRNHTWPLQGLFLRDTTSVMCTGEAAYQHLMPSAPVLDLLLDLSALCRQPHIGKHASCSETACDDGSPACCYSMQQRACCATGITAISGDHSTLILQEHYSIAGRYHRPHHCSVRQDNTSILQVDHCNVRHMSQASKVWSPNCNVRQVSQATPLPFQTGITAHVMELLPDSVRELLP